MTNTDPFPAGSFSAILPQDCSVVEASCDSGALSEKLHLSWWVQSLEKSQLYAAWRPLLLVELAEPQHLSCMPFHANCYVNCHATPLLVYNAQFACSGHWHSTRPPFIRRGRVWPPFLLALTRSHQLLWQELWAPGGSLSFP